MRWILLLLAALNAATLASETILFEESPANECYRYTRLPGAESTGIESCNMAIEQQALTTEDLAATYSNRGVLYARVGRLRQALADHDRAVELLPDRASVWINRGNAQMRARQFADARASLDHAIELGNEGLAAAYFNRALLLRQTGDLSGALADANRALAEAPESTRYQEFLAVLQGEKSE